MVVDRPVKSADQSQRFEGIEQLREGFPRFGGKRRHATHRDIFRCGAEPAGKKRLGFVADRAAVVEKFDHFDASVHGDRTLRFDALKFAPQLDLGRCGAGEQNERRREQPLLQVASRFHSLGRTRCGRHATALLLQVACGFHRSESRRWPASPFATCSRRRGSGPARLEPVLRRVGKRGPSATRGAACSRP